MPLLCSLLLAGLPGPESPAAAQVSPAPAPGGSQRIDRLEIVRQTVFPETTATPIPAVERLVNRLHHRTFESVIRREILIREGDTLDTLRMQESERLLRDRGFFESVDVSHRVEEGRNVVRVRTHDLWTLGIVLKYDKQAQISSLTFGLRDTNFLGTGNYLHWSQTVSSDQDELYFAAVVPRLWRSRASASFLYAELGNSLSRSVTVGRAHQTQYDRWCWGIGLLEAHGEQRFFHDGEEIGSSRFLQQETEGYVGRYTGDRTESGLGLGWLTRELQPRGTPSSESGEIEPPPAFEPRSFGGPLLFGGLMRRQFVPGRNLDRYGTIENVPLGWSIQLAASPNLRWESDPEHTFTARTILAGARSPLPGIGVSGEVTGAIYLRSNGLPGERSVRTIATAAWQPDPSALTIVQATVVLGADRPATTIYNLGTDTGLRGYPARAFAGQDYLLATLEQRLWSGIELAWVGLGGNLFVDTSIPSNNGRLRGISPRTGWGAGFLLGMRKSSQKPVRIEIAWRTDERSSPTFSISTSSSLRLIPRISLAPPTQQLATAIR
jgi:hypothetical protein